MKLVIYKMNELRDFIKLKAYFVLIKGLYFVELTLLLHMIHIIASDVRAYLYKRIKD